MVADMPQCIPSHPTKCFSVNSVRSAPGYLSRAFSVIRFLWVRVLAKTGGVSPTIIGADGVELFFILDGLPNIFIFRSSSTLEKYFIVGLYSGRETLVITTSPQPRTSCPESATLRYKQQLH